MPATDESPEWFRTNEKKETFESLKFANKLIDEVDADLYSWKWVILGVHNAMQATMVLALTGSTQMRVLSERSAMEVAERGNGVRKLADFMDLYRWVKRKKHMVFLMHSKPLQPSSQMNEDVAYVHKLRNNFNHFLPSGWSIRIDELPGVLASCMGVISFLAFESGNVFWIENPTAEELKAVISELQGKLKARSPAPRSKN
jgi:hypothetical protein